MFNFFKKKPGPPSWKLIRTFHKRDQYFIRNVEWGWLDQQTIFVKEYQRSKIVNLKNWDLLVFFHANGEMTVEAFVYRLAEKYESEIPERFEYTIIKALSDLAAAKYIIYDTQKRRPEKEFDEPGFTV